MPTPPDLTPQIEQVAAEPQTVSTDGQSATEYGIDQLIDADKYLKGNAAETAGGPKTGWARVRMARAVPPGSTGIEKST